MKKWVILTSILLFILVLHSVVAQVSINEVECNPAGTDNGHEWIELFNNGAPQNLSGWYIQDEQGTNYSLPSIVISDFYVRDDINGCSNSGEQYTLFDGTNAIQTTPILKDLADDELTQQRVPDATGSFQLLTGTKGVSNIPFEIQNISLNKQCIVLPDKIKVSAQISGQCISQVIIEAIDATESHNYSAVLQQGNYSALISTDTVDPSHTLDFVIHARNCYNATIRSSTTSVYVNANTKLTITPQDPTGANEWYTSQPLFTLSNPDAQDFWYRWESGTTQEYHNSFRLDKASNNANTTGGSLTLVYWSDLCGNETHQSKQFKFDFASPVIKNLVPANNAIVKNTTRPTISAYLDEIYAGNSGVNITSVELEIDGVSVVPQVTPADGKDAIVTFVPQNDFTQGNHSVEVFVRDYAGRIAQTNWKFQIAIPQGSTLQVISPQELIYTTRSLPLNISFTGPPGEILLFDEVQTSARPFVICRNCNSYGKDALKKRMFSEGPHKVHITTEQNGMPPLEKVIEFSVDSQSTKITKTMPKNGITNGSFSVDFIEQNPRNVMLIATENNSETTYTLPLTDCSIIKQTLHCPVEVNLTTFNNRSIKYRFAVTDKANTTVFSKDEKVKVDVFAPQFDWINIEHQATTASVGVHLSDDNFDKLVYRDLLAPSTRRLSFCTRLTQDQCEKRISLSKGEHLLEFYATDKAGNTQITSIAFIH